MSFSYIKLVCEYVCVITTFCYCLGLYHYNSKMSNGIDIHAMEICLSKVIDIHAITICFLKASPICHFVLHRGVLMVLLQVR